MGNFIFNQAKFKLGEWAARVNANDPANSVLVWALIASSGVESDAVLMDKDDWSGLVSGTTDFATNTGASRKVLDQSSGITITVDDTNDRTDIDCPDQTWTALANDGTGAVSDVTSGYDSDSTAGTDANISPGTWHDFPLSPDGSDVTMQVATAGFARAS